MTELATTEQNGAVEHPAESSAEMSALMQWAMDAKQANQVAQALATTSFVPASLRVTTPVTSRMDPAEIEEVQARDLRNTANNITGAILTGAELGLQPMAALRSIDIIQGSPALRAHAMRGLVQSAGHQVELVESTPELCRMRGRRRGSSGMLGQPMYGDWQEVAWTIGRAGQLGLLGKDQWKKQPQTMLVARATGELCRLIAADVLYAVPYAAEELDGDRPAAVQVTASRPVTAEEITGGRPAQSAPVNPTHEVDQARTAGRDRDVAQRHMFALLGDLAVKDRDDRLAVYSALSSRPVGTTDELTGDEIELIVNHLDGIKRKAEATEDKAEGAQDQQAEVGGLVAEGKRIRSAR